MVDYYRCFNCKHLFETGSKDPKRFFECKYLDKFFTFYQATELNEVCDFFIHQGINRKDLVVPNSEMVKSLLPEKAGILEGTSYVYVEFPLSWWNMQYKKEKKVTNGDMFTYLLRGQEQVIMRDDQMVWFNVSRYWWDALYKED